MLSIKNRFHGHGSVRRVYRQGKSFRGGALSLSVLSSDKTKTTRVAVVVSRKVHKSAVVRNRIRRRVYEIIRLQMPKFKHPAEAVITIYSAELAELPTEKLQKTVNDILKKARIL